MIYNNNHLPLQLRNCGPGCHAGRVELHPGLGEDRKFLEMKNNLKGKSSKNPVLTMLLLEPQGILLQKAQEECPHKIQAADESDERRPTII